MLIALQTGFPDEASSAAGIRVLAVDDDIAVVLVLDELDVQTVELRRIVGRPQSG